MRKSENETERGVWNRGVLGLGLCAWGRIDWVCARAHYPWISGVLSMRLPSVMFSQAKHCHLCMHIKNVTISPRNE